MPPFETKVEKFSIMATAVVAKVATPEVVTSLHKAHVVWPSTLHNSKPCKPQPSPPSLHPQDLRQ